MAEEKKLQSSQYRTNVSEQLDAVYAPMFETLNEALKEKEDNITALNAEKKGYAAKQNAYLNEFHAYARAEADKKQWYKDKCEGKLRIGAGCKDAKKRDIPALGERKWVSKAQADQWGNKANQTNKQIDLEEIELREIQNQIRETTLEYNQAVSDSMSAENIQAQVFGTVDQMSNPLYMQSQEKIRLAEIESDARQAEAIKQAEMEATLRKEQALEESEIQKKKEKTQTLAVAGGFLVFIAIMGIVLVRSLK